VVVTRSGVPQGARSVALTASRGMPGRPSSVGQGRAWCCTCSTGSRVATRLPKRWRLRPSAASSSTAHEDRLHRRRPAGLYFALLMKQLDPAHDITVVERNRPYDTFGWGVVFSDATMDNMRQWDRETADEIEAFNHWDDIELHFKGRVHPLAAATASWASAARSCSTSCRRAARRWA
jgi:hypothetical protein